MRVRSAGVRSQIERTHLAGHVLHGELQQLARKTSTKVEDAEEIQAFWENYPQNARVQWLLAYYAETTGEASVVRVTATECSQCSGTGVREAIDLLTSGNNQEGDRGTDLRSCPACHHIGVVRRVAFR